MTRHLLTAALLAVVLPAPAFGQAETWWGHVTALADDSMRGRQTGSPEHRKAAEYVASVFQRAGLEPAGTDGWFQPVRFRVRQINEPRSSLALVRGGKAEPLAFGTDAPVEPLEPLRSLHAAVTRQRADGSPPGGWYPEQRVTLAEAVRAYTLGSAIAAGVERDLGDLDIGKRADLVVLSSDVFREPPEALLQTRVDATVVDGEVVYLAL